MKIDDKVTFSYPPVPDTFSNISTNAYEQLPGPTVSNPPYSLRNCNFRATSNTTKKTQKNKNYNW